MYIRWVKRGHRNSQIADVVFHDAYLVESYRNEEGKPRQRTISYLGNVRQIGDEFPVIERELFLLRAENVLQCLSDLSPAEREQVLTLLHDKIPPLTRDEIMEGFRNTLGWYCHWWQKHGTPPTPDEIHNLIKNVARDFDLW